MRVDFWGPAGIIRPPQPDPRPAGQDERSDTSTRAISDLLAAITNSQPHPRDVRFGAHIVRTLAAAERFLTRPSARGEQP
jgi:hypothetical protein